MGFWYKENQVKDKVNTKINDEDKIGSVQLPYIEEVKYPATAPEISLIVRQHTPIEEPQVEGDDDVVVNFPQ